MTADIPDLDCYRLKTTFNNDYVIHTVYDPATNVSVETKWIDKRYLGSGGFGVVILQEKEGGGQLRAVKRLARGMGKIDRSQELRALSKVVDVCIHKRKELTLFEANCSTSWQHQDLFVQFFGWYEDRHSTFIAMEFIENGDLSEYLKKSAPEAKLNAREIAKQLSKGLAILHEQKICHRDLKPQVWPSDHQ